MVRILSDTSALFTIEEGRQMGLEVIPLSVTIDDHTYLDLQEIDGAGLIELIEQGHIPTSSQPSVGETMRAYESAPGEELLYLTMADGLSGTYQSACGARAQLEPNQHIHVLNTRTLCGPHRYLVQRALQAAKQGLGAREILAKLQHSVDHSLSFLIPNDFDFLRRGGRLSSFSAAIGGMLKIVPVVRQNEEGNRLVSFAMKRNFKGAVDAIGKAMQRFVHSEEDPIYISHACAPDLAQRAYDMMRALFARNPIEILPLSPVFVTQGGPRCVAIQTLYA